MDSLSAVADFAFNDSSIFFMLTEGWLFCPQLSSVGCHKKQNSVING
jgi:hypothetical protein